MTALAEAAVDLSPAAAQALAARVPAAMQIVAEANGAALQATLTTEFAAWAASGAPAEVYAGAYVAAATRVSGIVYDTSATLVQDYVALHKLPVMELPAYDALGRAALMRTQPWIWTPQKQLGESMSAGVARSAAVENAARVAGGLGSIDIQDAQKSAIGDMQKARPDLIVGARKVLSGGACGWCQMVADQMYHGEDTVSTHRNDRCGTNAVVANDNWKPGTLAAENTDWDELRKETAVPSPWRDDL